MTENDTNNFDDIAQLWQTNETSDETITGKDVRLSLWAQYWVFALETMISLAGFGFGLYLAIIKGSLFVGLSVTAFSLTALGFSLWARLVEHSVATGAVKAELARALTIAERRYRWAWSGVFVCAAAVLFVAGLMFNQFILSTPTLEEYEASISLYVFALVYISGFIIALGILIDRARRSLASLQTLAKELG
ncbi:hypothetical protein KFE96_09620 [Kordiimonas sp. SCSIO 12603]|uniref:hypothetical protein n=1 Tax=Kordiimonas sp. SCSIO 12603 TaxID=2829596 RepID=UPI002105C4C9|nr:hypothetical protein [Kordiimonas sp. SCSIO 12603]UTW57124.1 hypothetical protein KFE96_09620 [Kordiimonas sp. SCSIO 12603]